LDVESPEPIYIYARVRQERFQTEADTIRVIKYHDTYPSGNIQFYWDGRDESGAMVPLRAYCFGVWGYRPNLNAIMVYGGTPRISVDSGSVMPVSVRPYENPYRMEPAASEFTVTFGLSHDAYVSAGVYDSSGALVRALINEEFRAAGTQTVYWNAAASDGSMLPKGYYRIILQAHYQENYSEPIVLHAELVF
jgi:hypothetical protein